MHVTTYQNSTSNIPSKAKKNESTHCIHLYSIKLTNNQQKNLQTQKSNFRQFYHIAKPQL